MLNRIKALFEAAGHGAGKEGSTAFAAPEIAEAALMVEAATLDGEFDEIERQAIIEIVMKHFDLTREEAESLLEQAIIEQDGAVQLLQFTRVIKDNFDEAGRIALIERLWEVAYADGKIHDYEANLIRRVAGLLYVPDRESGEAKLRVRERLGIIE